MNDTRFIQRQLPAVNTLAEVEAELKQGGWQPGHAGIWVNPQLPERFSSTDNERRPLRHLALWGVPFIESYRDTHPKFIEAWPSGVRWDVRCLDGGAWDRPTCWGMAPTLEAALAIAKSGPSWRKEAA